MLTVNMSLLICLYHRSVFKLSLQSSTKEEKPVESTLNDGPKKSLEFKDQSSAPTAEKRGLLEEEDEEGEDAFPTVVSNAKV